MSAHEKTFVRFKCLYSEGVTYNCMRVWFLYATNFLFFSFFQPETALILTSFTLSVLVCFSSSKKVACNCTLFHNKVLKLRTKVSVIQYLVLRYKLDIHEPPSLRLVYFIKDGRAPKIELDLLFLNTSTVFFPFFLSSFFLFLVGYVYFCSSLNVNGQQLGFRVSLGQVSAFFAARWRTLRLHAPIPFFGKRRCFLLFLLGTHPGKSLRRLQWYFVEIRTSSWSCAQTSSSSSRPYRNIRGRLRHFLKCSNTCGETLTPYPKTNTFLWRLFEAFAELFFEYCWESGRGCIGSA